MRRRNNGRWQNQIVLRKLPSHSLVFPELSRRCKQDAPPCQIQSEAVKSDSWGVNGLAYWGQLPAATS